MTVVKHELRRGFKAFCIWTASIAFLMVICVFTFPEMKGQMDGVSEMFSSMGSFTEAFGMDRLNFGTLIGFYAIECGNILGIGGAFYAALIAVSALAKEEKDRTAEFLLAHPVSRCRIVTEKLLAVAAMVVALNVVAWGLSAVSIVAIGEEIPWGAFNLIHLAYLLMQLELCGICFGISAFMRRGSLGVGIGFAALMYFLGIVSNISDSARFLKYITPFSYTEGADIVTNGSLDTKYILIGAAYTVICVALAYWHYCKKDINS